MKRNIYIKKWLGLFFVLCIVCSLTIPTYAATKVTKVKLSETSISLTEGKKKTLSVKIAPSNASNKKITWKSSNSKVASVSSKGTVTAKKKGSATITATSKANKSKKATCKIKVGASTPVKSIRFSKKISTLYEGQQFSLVTKVLPANASTPEIKYSSSDTGIIKVSSTGILTGINNGSAIIKATSTDGSKKTASCKIKVKKAISINISQSNMDLFQGDVGNLTAIIKNGTASKVKWTSSNAEVAMVSSGKIKAVGGGTAVITVTSQEDKTKSASCSITVKAPSLVLSENSKVLDIGETSSITAILQNSNADISWSNSSSSILDMAPNGNTCTFTAKKSGNAKITATAGNLKIICNISVKEVKLSVTGSNVIYDEKVGYMTKIYVGEYADVKVLFSNNIEKPLKWTSQNTKVASIYNSDSIANSIYGVTSGNTTVTAKTDDGDLLKVTVEVLNPVLKEIVLPSKDVYTVGETDYIYVHYNPSSAKILAYVAESSDTNVLTATHLGNGQFMLKAIRSGSAVLTFRLVDDSGNLISKEMNIQIK